MTTSRPEFRRVDVCVCTFRRATVADTLRSLAGQTLPEGTGLRTIVADNDETESARSLVESTARDVGLEVRYVHAPARNISVARNAALEVTNAAWIAFIDDDEVASPGWLAALLASACETSADIVLGPVLPVYGPEAPPWMRAGGFHATRPVFRRGTIWTGYAGNVLIRRDIVSAERFHPELGRSGGEDTEFFARLHRRGARIAYAPDAVISEFVLAERARLGWLLRRRFRFGQTHGALLAAEGLSGPSRVLAAGLAAAKCGYCAGGAILRAFSPERRAFWLMRGALHAGALARLLGTTQLEPYGAEPSPNPSASALWTER